MSTNSKIEWTEHTWNPVTGCTKVSQGCKNCYAETMYERFNGHGSFKNIICHDNRLNIPLKWKKPAMVFVNSMSDLFHEKVPFAFINKVFDVMELNQHLTFQVLTKRAFRMKMYMQSRQAGKYDDSNVWLGVSVEDQAAADERIPLLMETPATVRFLSCEPLLGPVAINCFKYHTGSIGRFCRSCTGTGRYNDNFKTPCPDCDSTGKTPWGIDWVICGGESGIRSRPMHPDWARQLRDQCKEEKIPFFFKQWGSWLFGKRIGKKKAGNVLDGKAHKEFPVINQ